MSGGRIKLDLDSILQGYGFLTMLPSGDLLNFGNSGNNYQPLSILVSISVLGQTQNGCLQVSFAKWKTRSDARSNQSVRAHKALFHISQCGYSEGQGRMARGRQGRYGGPLLGHWRVQELQKID